jgi:hypothetical protein
MVLRTRHGIMKMLCGKNTHIILKILEILLILCKEFTEDSAKIRGEDCNIPKDIPQLYYEL